MKGYVSADEVAVYMGVTFTAAQEALCEIAISAAENWIDSNIKHAWLEESPVTETFYDPQGPYLLLSKAPIISVTSLTYNPTPAGISIPLVAGTQFFVQDIAHGRIYVPYVARAYSLVAEYLPNTDDVPSEVHMAAMIIAASHMRLMPALMDGADPNVVQRYIVGGELTVEFRKSLQLGGPVPQQALDYLDVWLKNYVVV